MEILSIGGSRYFLLLKDDFSSYRDVIFIKSKSGVKTNLAKCITLAERETGNKLKVLRTDSGLECMNHKVRELLENRVFVINVLLFTLLSKMEEPRKR